MNYKIKPINANCNHCGSQHENMAISDFKENNCYPPTVHFMCQGCGRMADLISGEIPPLIFNKLITKIMSERGWSDQPAFNRMNNI